MIPLACWNVRGLNKLDHQAAARELISSHHLRVCALLETRVDTRNSSVVSSKIEPTWSWYIDYTHGPGKRIWIGWDAAFVDLAVLGGNDQIIHCKVIVLDGHSVFYVSFAYGLNTRVERRELWDEMMGYSEHRVNDAWAVMGDFNAILDHSEALGGRDDDEVNDELQACLAASDLTTLPMEGPWYSWSNKQSGTASIWRRLDRVVANPLWFVKFPHVSYLCSQPKTSDHSPLIIKGESRRHGKNPWFRFENFLADTPEFLETVEQIWKHNIYGVPLYAVMCKLKCLKPIFKEMKRRKGDLSANVQEASTFLDTVQKFMVHYPTFSPLLHLEQMCRFIYTRAVYQEQSYLKQRAKVAWLKEGDQCTSFFFRRMAVRRAKARINRLEGENGQIIDEPSLITKEIVGFYEQLLGTSIEPDVGEGSLSPFIRKRLSNESAIRMVRPVSMEEIKEVLFGFNDNKAPGPDGFNSRFFKRAWNVIGEEISKAIMNFFETGQLIKQVNSTIISMIPKVEVPKHAKDFRPISCCNVLYKVISKILTNRMCEFLDTLVDKSQTAFIPGRRISDNVLLAQELLHGYNQKNMPGRCSFKVDIMKAYDTIEWKFVIEMLKTMNFHPIFIGWIQQCITSPSFSININGAAEGYFMGKRGLRQGDPISPYIFVLVMEVLHGIVEKCIDEEPRFKYHWKCHRTKTVMLSFADDLLLFCNADPLSIQTLKTGIDIFGRLSGLRANPTKSNIFFSKNAISEGETLRQIVGFSIGTLPVRYLGVPLITSKLTISDCKPLVEKVDKRLGSWTNKTLSYAGRVQLIKSVLSSLHVYWAGMFILPKAVLRTIEARLRRFLWYGTASTGYSKVGWETVCLRQSEGGLGITPLLPQNQALMVKHIWALLVDNGSSVWVAWIRANRLRNESFWSVHLPSSCSWSWRQLLKLRPQIQHAFQYNVGNGRKFLLWRDPWHPKGLLGNIYNMGPLLTGLPNDVRLSTVIQDGQWTWPASTRFEIQNIIESLPPIHANRDDWITWKLTQSGKFTTSSALTIFRNDSPKVAWSSLFKGPGKIPSHQFILWLAIRERLPMREKPWIGNGETSCVLCNSNSIEDHNHMFFACSFSGRCIEILHERVKFKWQHTYWDRGIMWAAKRWRGKHLINMAYRILLSTLIYMVWQERNTRIFEQKESTPEVVAARILNTVRDRLLTMDLDDSIQCRAVKRLWHIAW